MDSLTQALLGAQTFALVKDKAIGKKSLLIGALAGTIPDLDVLISPFFNEIQLLSFHRSVSHSVVFAIIMSYILALIFHYRYEKKHKFRSWYIAFFLAIFTHSILDYFTTFGIKILSPFNDKIFSINSIHTLEPIYTGVLLIGTLILGFRKYAFAEGLKVIRITLILSTVYLAWSVVSKQITLKKFEKVLQEKNIEIEKIMISPTPMNTLLWHCIAKTKDGFYFGTSSILDKDSKIQLYFERSEEELLANVKDLKYVQYYLNYTQGFPMVKKGKGANLHVFAVKYGPVNYYGKPEFVYPLNINLQSPTKNNIHILYGDRTVGPFTNFSELKARIVGKQNIDHQ